MKTSFKTIKAIVIIILITSGFAFAQESSTTDSNPNLPARPEKRSGESDASFRNRMTQWKVEVRHITSEQAAQNKDEELQRLRQELAKLTERVSLPSTTGSFTNTSSENMLIIPSGEIKTEELLSINEDMNIMSRIFSNELQKVITSSNYVPPWENTSETLTSVGLRTGRNLNLLISSMYLQGYGALFIINVNFPISATSETYELPEIPDKENINNIWEQTRQDIYEPQASVRRTTGMGYIGERKTTEVTYDPQKVENLKISLIQALRHASNIRALQSDESVILRIIGTGQSLKIITAQKQENDVHDIWLITLESEGTRYTIKVSGDIDANLKIMSAPAALIIRAKKSDLDAFARDELDLEQFRQRVQIISFPLLQTTLPSTTTPGRTTGTRRTDTTGTTTSSTSQRGRTTTAVVPKPTYETEN